MRAVTLQDQYCKHFDGYIELIEDDAILFSDSTTPAPSPLVQALSPKRLWYLGHYPTMVEEPATDFRELPPKVATC